MNLAGYSHNLPKWSFLSPGILPLTPPNVFSVLDYLPPKKKTPLKSSRYWYDLTFFYLCNILLEEGKNIVKSIAFRPIGYLFLHLGSECIFKTRFSPSFWPPNVSSFHWDRSLLFHPTRPSRRLARRRAVRRFIGISLTLACSQPLLVDRPQAV